MAEDTTALGQVSREVPDSATMTDDDIKAAQLATMLKVAPRLREVIERIDQIQRVIGETLPDVIRDHPLGVVVDLVADIKDCIEQLHGDGSTVVTNKLKGRLNYAREVSFPERLRKDKVKNFSTDDWRVAGTTRILASIIGGKQDEAYEWLKEHELGSLIKPTVNASSLSAAAKEMMEGGREFPDELFNVHPKDGVSFTRVKKGRG